MGAAAVIGGGIAGKNALDRDAAKKQAESQVNAEALAQKQFELENERRRQVTAEFRAEREKDLSQGRTRGQELFGEGSMGTRSQDQINQGFQDIIARRQQALSGMSPEERNAMESQVLGGINQGVQTQSRQLRAMQGAQGLRGGAAVGQQAQLLQQGQRDIAGAQQNIFLQDLAARRGALDSYEQTQAAEQERRNKERLGQLSTEFGYAGLGAAERAGAGQIALGQTAATQAALKNDQASQKGGGGK
jgi:hypothetical protein